jgi:glycosyltransferase involved in cell wall biosynthesis
VAVSRPLAIGLLVYGLDRPASGIGRYTIELIRALDAGEPDVELTLLKPFPEPIRGLESVSARVRQVKLPGGRLLPGVMTAGPIAIAAIARRHHLDLVHDPIGIGPFLPRSAGRIRRVVTIHDAIPFVHPETQPWLTNALFRRYLPVTLRFVDRVITDSSAARSDLERFFPAVRGRVEVIHLGVNPSFRPRPEPEIETVLRRYGLRPPYLLTVGALQPRKNIERVIDAFAQLRSNGLPHQLAVVGAKAWKTTATFQRAAALGDPNALVLTGYVDDADLPALYSGADCFVFPSLYEGFGLPPLEAMACGTPVVASRASSLPEVIGEAGLLVPPTEVTAIAGAIGRVLAEPAYAAMLRERGRQRAATFTWERAAAEHAALYRRLVFG